MVTTSACKSGNGIGTVEYVTPRQAAKLLGMSQCSMYRWIKRGWLDKIAMPNGTFRIRREDVDRILAGK